MLDIERFRRFNELRLKDDASDTEPNSVVFLWNISIFIGDCTVGAARFIAIYIFQEILKIIEEIYYDHFSHFRIYRSVPLVHDFK